MKVVRAGLYFLFAFSVLAFGGVEVWSESVVEIGAAALLVLWAAIAYGQPEVKLEWNPLNWPLLGLIGIGLLQLLFRTTAYAYFTRTELLNLTAYLIVFFLAAQVFRKRRELTGLAWFLILLGFVVSLFGIIQHFTSSSKIYWYLELPPGRRSFWSLRESEPFRRVHGAFVAGGPRFDGLPWLAPRSFPLGNTVDHHSRQCAHSVGFSRRDRKFRV